MESILSKYRSVLYHKTGLFSLKFFNYSDLFDMISRNGGHSLVGIFIRLLPAMRGGVTHNVIKSIKLILLFLSSIAKNQGAPGLVRYLKQVSVLTQQVIGGHKTPTTLPRVKRTKSGIPVLFPANVREMIRRRNSFFITLSLTIASLYRDMIYSSPPDFDSIVGRFTGDERMINQIKGFIPQFVNSFVPASMRGEELIAGKLKLFPILTSSPQTYIRGWEADSNSPLCISSSSFIGLIKSAYVMPKHFIKYFEHLYEAVGIPRNNFAFLSFLFRFNKVPDLISTIKFCMEYGGSMLYGKGGKKLPISPTNNCIGKLGLKQEAAGKMRVFAMVDPWTQWIMYPFHKALFAILAKRSNVDGTFNQLGPISRIPEGKPLYSMDLSSATDRLPISIQTPLITRIFNLSYDQGNAWEKLLIERPYLVPMSGGSQIHYAVGQPMGALSSWAMLAMTHHLIVQFAAYKSGLLKHRNQLFVEYAVLGDDIVIYNSIVAKQYHHIITSIGVKCNLNKSIMSPSGDALEFAKRTFCRGVNVSPRPLKEFFMSQISIVAFSDYIKKYNLGIPQALRVAGFGWRVISQYQKPFFKLNIKVRYLLLILALTDDNFIKILDRSLSNGYKAFCEGFAKFLGSYCVDLFGRIFRLEETSKSWDILRTTVQPRFLVKDWVDSLDVPVGTSKKSIFRWPGNPLHPAASWMRSWYQDVNPLESDVGNPMEVIAALNEQMIKSILDLTQTSLKTVGRINLHFGWTFFSKLEKDSSREALRFLIKTMFHVLRLEAVLSSKALRDLCLRPAELISKRPGEPRIFRVHMALNRFISSYNKVRKEDQKH